jgi:hypothetical protein
MPKRKNRETDGVMADASDALVAAFSARLEALVASWQLAIKARRSAPVADGDAPLRTPTEVLGELERELADVERRCEEQRKAAELEANEASVWESRVMQSLRDGRDDLAKHALVKQQEHSAAAAEREAETTELESVRDAYRNAVTAVRATSASASDT